MAESKLPKSFYHNELFPGFGFELGCICKNATGNRQFIHILETSKPGYYKIVPLERTYEHLSDAISSERERIKVFIDTPLD